MVVFVFGSLCFFVLFLFFQCNHLLNSVGSIPDSDQTAVLQLKNTFDLLGKDKTKREILFMCLVK